MGYLIGIDIGTGGTKAAAYDLSGNVVANSYFAYTPESPEAGASEIDPLVWWEAVKHVARDILGKVAVGKVKAIGLSGLNGLVAVGKEGHPIRNAVLYNDLRSVHQARWIEERIGCNEVLRITGNRTAPGTFSAPVMLWCRFSH